MSERDWSGLGIDFGAFDPLPEKREAPPAPEPVDPVMPLPELAGQGFSDSELAALWMIFRKTVDEGHALHKCDDPEQVQRWADFLNCHLPEDRHAAVIRQCELNSYTVRWSSPSRQCGEVDAGVRARFRNWWWESFDCEGDAGEFDAETLEAANELLPIAQNLTWPDFKVQTEGSILKLRRVCERHYPASDAPDEDACGS